MSLILISIGLAMDAFAVSISNGACLGRPSAKLALKIALFFGFFQSLMPLIGWWLGKRFEKMIQTFDHWVIFAILVLVGSRMIYDTFSHHSEKKMDINRLKILLALSLATSIDAFGVGVGLAFLQINILSAILVIGLITFGLCVFGVLAGGILCRILGRKVEAGGGLILIIIGTKILIEHFSV